MKICIILIISVIDIILSDILITKNGLDVELNPIARFFYAQFGGLGGLIGLKAVSYAFASVSLFILYIKKLSMYHFAINVILIMHLVLLLYWLIVIYMVLK